MPSLAEDERIEGCFTQLKRRPFQYQRGPLVRAALLGLSASRHIFWLSLAALCGDAWSARTLVRDIGRYYEAALQGDTVAHDVVQYADYADVESAFLTNDAVESAYWSRYQMALPPRLPGEQGCLSLDKEPGCSSRWQDPTVTARIESLAAEWRLAPEILMLACWQVLLSRLSRRSAMPVSVLYSGRPYAVLSPVVGLFEAMVPVLCHAEPSLVFNQFVTEVDEAYRAMVLRQHYLRAGDAHFLNNDPATLPLCFEYTDAPRSWTTAGLRWRLEREYSHIHPFKLKLACINSDHGMTLNLHYRPDLYHRADVERFGAGLETVLHGVLENPRRRLADIPLLRRPERAQVLVEWNRTRTAALMPPLIQQRVEEHARRWPDRIALEYQGRRLSYAALNAKANQLAHVLRNVFRVRPDDLVGILVPCSDRFVIGVLAILKAGAAYVPIDPQMNEARQRYIMADSHLAALLVDKARPSLPDLPLLA
jgi:non-ribosomal peptide synthetase component F